MISKILQKVFLFLLLILLVGSVSAANANVSVTVDTTIIDSNYLDANIWMLIVVLGILCMFLSHIPGWDKTNPIWACLSPFFTFAALWFCNSLQYTYTDVITLGDGTYNIVLEHFIYHMDWMAIGLLGIVFVFSCLNVAYVLSGNSIKKHGSEELNTKQNKYDE